MTAYILSGPSLNLKRVKELMRNGYVCGSIYFDGLEPSGLFSGENFLRTLTYGGLLKVDGCLRGDYKLVCTNKISEAFFHGVDMAVCEEI